MHRFTLGVEEEFQIVDPETWELRSHVTELLAASSPVLGDQIKRELHQSIVEVGTKICTTTGELAEEIIRTRRDLSDAEVAMGYVDAYVEPDADLTAIVRGKDLPVRIVPLPFVAPRNRRAATGAQPTTPKDVS